MKYLRIRNFEKFQHYRDRRPPWIKLYRELWSDPEFFALSESERYFLISFFIIASQNDNRIPDNESWLKREMATRKAIPVERLIDTKWLEWVEQNASQPLATSVHDDSITLALTRGRESEKEKEKSREETEKPEFVATELDFQDIWRKHPNPKGRKEALRHFKASVKTLEDLADMQRALENYRNQRLNENAKRKECGTNEIPWQNGSTWFNNWRDWIPEEDFEKPDDQLSEHVCHMCGDDHVWPCVDPHCTLEQDAPCAEYFKHKQRALAAKA